jgi:hypothetical protein
LVAEMPDAYRARGDVNAALGRVYAAMGLFEVAIKYFLSAVKTSDADTGAVEQLANCEAREAARLLEPYGEQDPIPEEVVHAARAHFVASQQRLDALITLGASAERHALRGATLRRLSRFEGRFGLSGLRKAALDAYDSAFREHGPTRYYPALVAQSMRLSSDPNDVDLEVVRDARKAAEARGPSDAYAVISAIELELLEIITRRSLEDPPAGPDTATIERFARSLLDAFEAVGATASERNSTLTSVAHQQEVTQNPLVQAWFGALKLALGRG